MKFTVPGAKPADAEAAYQAIIDEVKDQLRIPIGTRRIASIRYLHDKRRYLAKVGGLDPQQGRYQVVAILEAKPHIIYTRTEAGGQGLTMLVNSDEITEIIDFA